MDDLGGTPEGRRELSDVAADRSGLIALPASERGSASEEYAHRGSVVRLLGFPGLRYAGARRSSYGTPALIRHGAILR